MVLLFDDVVRLRDTIYQRRMGGSTSSFRSSSRSTSAFGSSSLSKPTTTFTLALFKKLSEENKTGNIFYSPFSISSALAMVMLGARGNTVTQMSECLETRDCQDDVHVSFGQLLSELNKANAPYALSVANRLYGEQSYQFIEHFLMETRTHYHSEVGVVDFKTRSCEATDNINNWVEKQTQGKIKDVVAKGMLDEETRLVLVNAIYFKGSWKHQFPGCETYDAPFNLNKNTTKPVKMMTQITKFRLTFISEANCQILEIPYKGNELSMLIFLPKEIEDDTTGLQRLEKQLTYENFVKWTHPGKMKVVEVDVSLPQFKIEESYDLQNVLKSMGMVDAFDAATCDFSGMSKNKDLVLSKVVHKAFVEVNEKGTEAAAATAVKVKTYDLFSSCSNDFRADHPFLFFIRHNTTMSILFAGRFCSPE